MSSKWILKKRSWRGTASENHSRADQNPVRGFYHVYTYDLSKEEAEEDWIWSLCRDERLALVFLDIGKCAHRALFDRELAKAGRIFSLFRDNGMQMIVRIAYDRVGQGMEHEPRKIGRVIGHMRQIGPVLAAFSPHILTVQGLFIGSWGEMHDSKFLEKDALIRLYGTLREATGNLRISVRKPQYQRILRLPGGVMETGLYDDAILASGTDMGTFGWIDDVENPDIMWTPERELAFMQVQNTRTLCGGEVLCGALAYSGEEVLARMQRMHLTYLNSVHEPTVWENWRSRKYPVHESGSSDGGMRKQACPVYGNGTLCDEIRARLGYRYELEDIKLCGARVKVLIKNSGFACCYDTVRALLFWGGVQAEAPFDGKMLAAGETLCVEFDITDAFEAQGGEEALLHVALRHEKTGLPIYFADVPASPDPDKWDRYRSISSLPEGVPVGVLSSVKEAIS